MKTERPHLPADQFVALILDNEVTVGEFVVTGTSWSRLVRSQASFRLPKDIRLFDGCTSQVRDEKWDEVSLPCIMRTLAGLDESVDYVLFGNNAGQGLPLAQSLPPNLMARRSAIIYANNLPEINTYERLGYRTFFRRSEAASHLLELAKNASRPLAFYFINTIQHNQFKCHDP
jgi:hypothetical protein